MPPDHSTLASNNGRERSDWFVTPVNEDLLRLDLRILKHAFEYQPSFGSALGDEYRLDLPQIACSRLSFRQFLSALDRWSSLPLAAIAAERFTTSHELALSGCSLRVTVGDDELERTSPDHRRLLLTYERFGFSAAVAFTLDPTVVAEFIRPFVGIYFERQ
jgi:hypothetical protein